MKGLEEGMKVRIDIPDQEDPDYDSIHGRFGEIIEVIEDDAGRVTGDGRDSAIYRVQLEDGEVVDCRWRDIRPK